MSRRMASVTSIPPLKFDTVTQMVRMIPNGNPHHPTSQDRSVYGSPLATALSPARMK